MQSIIIIIGKIDLPETKKVEYKCQCCNNSKPETEFPYRSWGGYECVDCLEEVD